MRTLKKFFLSVVAVIAALFILAVAAAIVEVANGPSKEETSQDETTLTTDTQTELLTELTELTGAVTSEAETETQEATTVQESTIAIVAGARTTDAATTDKPTTTKSASEGSSSQSIPAYSGKAYVALNNNTPLFTQSELTKTSFERYSSLDGKGRCGVAYACVGKDIMPTEERGAIGAVKPTGWHTIKYDCVDGKYLYNRCHLIGFQLTGENANERNLITGTRYLNIEGMLPFENLVADYVKETGNHVMYRVTPVFSGSNLLASGVKIEGYSVEDNGEGVCFYVYCYNVQPGVTITYSNGDSHLTNDSVATTAKAASTTKNTTTQNKTPAEQSHEATYILNTNTKKFHLPGCGSVSKMSEKNKQEFHGTRDAIIAQGYSPCGNCDP